jgi:DNA-binding NtrC family response regulator
MKLSNVVLLQGDSQVVQSLLHSLKAPSYSTHATRSLDELRKTIARHHADVAVVDIEVTPITEVESLSRNFPETRIICTHRLADEQMWTTALGAGASDVVHNDTGSILAAVTGRVLGRSAAA